jgi:hypothetical protein
VANCGLRLSHAFAAGSYNLAIQYVMQGGALTTFSDLQGQMDVYQMDLATTPT